MNEEVGPDIGAYPEEKIANALEKRLPLRYRLRKYNDQARTVLSSTAIRRLWFLRDYNNG